MPLGYCQLSQAFGGIAALLLPKYLFCAAIHNDSTIVNRVCQVKFIENRIIYEKRHSQSYIETIAVALFINIIFQFKIDKNIPCKRSCLYKEIPRNAFKNLEIRRKKNITNYFVRKKAIKACVPILLKAIFGEKVANVIFKVYPKMALWS